MTTSLTHPDTHFGLSCLFLGFQHLKFTLVSQEELALVQSPYKLGMDFVISKFSCHLISSTITKIIRYLQAIHILLFLREHQGMWAFLE